MPSKYSYVLPESKIAKQPNKVRGSSKLLVLSRQSGMAQDWHYAKLAEKLEPDDLVIINETKVIKARLHTSTRAGQAKELLILELHGKINQLHESKVMIRGKLRPGDILEIGHFKLTVKTVANDGTATVTSNANILDIAALHGEVPLPPYLKRRAEESDVDRYQTIFANQQGSVAAPTASLNLTEDIMASLEKKGIKIERLTLHVGLGTFMPIRTENLDEHKMHREYFYIPAKTIKAIRDTKKNGHRVVAIGTTVSRALEFSADRLLSDESGTIEGEADIFIYPGYKFKIVSGLLTNFHAPKSTVLMMAAAFAGWDNLIAAYEHALSSDYKFLSYGDSMLII